MAGIQRGRIASTAPQGQAEGRDGYGYGLRSGSVSREAGSWEPTVTYLLVLIAIEFAAYVALRYAFRSVHGG